MNISYGDYAFGQPSKFLGSRTLENHKSDPIIDFEKLKGFNPLSGVGGGEVAFKQYANEGITFNSPAVFDWGNSGVAHSGSKAIEQCFGVEFCTESIKMDFTAPQSRVKVWVGTSDQRTVALRVFDSHGNQIGQATAMPVPGPIRTPLEINLQTPNITSADVTYLNNFPNNGLSVDDVQFDNEVPICPTDHNMTNSIPMKFNLTGIWSADDGANYYIKQIGRSIVWTGLSNDHGINNGLTFTNVFCGSINTQNQVIGDWANVPRGMVTSQGTLNLQLENKNHFFKNSGTGGHFTASNWNRLTSKPLSPSEPNDISSFSSVHKTDGTTLEDNLKPYHDNVVVFGNVSSSVNINYPYVSLLPDNIVWRSCSNCDGDINFDTIINRTKLNLLGSPGSSGDFWHSGGWLFPNDPSVFDGGIPAKLDNNKQTIHDEIIMDGQSIEPGWLDAYSHSVLVNGIPANGKIVSWADPNSGNIHDSPMLKSIYGQNKINEEIKTINIPIGTKVRVTGPLVLDCGHFEFNPLPQPHPCNEDDTSKHNVEIHPVYSIDFIQNFSLARPNATLTGVYSGNMGETYYVNQIGKVVWMLALSRDHGQTSTNVFHGVIESDGKIHGNLAAVPLGIDNNSGAFMMDGNNPQLQKSTRIFNSLTYDNPQHTQSNTLEKLYDVPYKYISTFPSLNTSRYVISIDNFKIENTRAVHEDTDSVTMGAEINNSPLTLLTNHTFVGDVNNGVHTVNLNTGPFTIGPKDILSFYFGLDNGNGNNNCDGSVASDSFNFTGNQLDVNTRSTGTDSFSQTKHYHGTDSNTGCGSNSEYDVTWTIHKLP